MTDATKSKREARLKYDKNAEKRRKYRLDKMRKEVIKITSLVLSSFIFSLTAECYVKIKNIGEKEVEITRVETAFDADKYFITQNMDEINQEIDNLFKEEKTNLALNIDEIPENIDIEIPENILVYIPYIEKHHEMFGLTFEEAIEAFQKNYPNLNSNRFSEDLEAHTLNQLNEYYKEIGGFNKPLVITSLSREEVGLGLLKTASYYGIDDYKTQLLILAIAQAESNMGQSSKSPTNNEMGTRYNGEFIISETRELGWFRNVRSFLKIMLDNIESEYQTNNPDELELNQIINAMAYDYCTDNPSYWVGLINEVLYSSNLVTEFEGIIELHNQQNEKTI